MSFNIALRRGGTLREEIDLREVASSADEVLHITMHNAQIEVVSVDMLDADGRTIMTSPFNGRARQISVAIPADARRVRVTGAPETMRIRDAVGGVIGAREIPAGKVSVAAPAQKPTGPHEIGHPVSTMCDAITSALSGNTYGSPPAPTRIAVGHTESVIIDERPIETTDPSFVTDTRSLAEYRATHSTERLTRRQLIARYEDRGDRVNMLTIRLGHTLDRYEEAAARAADLGRAARAAHQAGEKARNDLSYTERSLVARENEVARLEREKRETTVAMQPTGGDKIRMNALDLLADNEAVTGEHWGKLLDAIEHRDAAIKQQRDAKHQEQDRADAAEQKVREATDDLERTQESLSAAHKAIDVQAEELTKAHRHIEELSQRHAIDRASAEAIDALLAEHGADMTGMTLAEALRTITAAYAERGRQNTELQKVVRAANLRGSDTHELVSEQTQRADRAERKLKRAIKRRREARQAQYEAEKSRDMHLRLQARAVEITNRMRKDLAEMTEHRDSLNARFDEALEDRDSYEHDLALAREEVEQVRGALEVAEGMIRERDAKLAECERAERIAKVVDHVQDTGRAATIGGVELTKREGTVIAGGITRIDEGEIRTAKIHGDRPAFRHTNMPCSVEPVLTPSTAKFEVQIDTAKFWQQLGVSPKTFAHTVRNLQRARAKIREQRAAMELVSSIASQQLPKR